MMNSPPLFPLSSLSPLSPLSPSQLTGQSEEHLDRLPESKTQVHREVVGPLRELTARARAAGFELQVASGFRSFLRQQQIWNAKARKARKAGKAEGRRALPPGQALDQALEDEEKLWAILRWSALPGASRHHWGSDVDVFDQKALRHGDNQNYRVKLIASEVAPEGIFGPFHQWLDEELQQEGHPFFRPYGRDLGGVACEQWHLSYAPLSLRCQEDYSFDLFYQTIEAQGDQLELADLALKNARQIYQRFVIQTTSPSFSS